MLREIVLDTETTGTEHAQGDRLIEIGCVELLDHIPTGRTYHVYVNPQRPVSQGAFEVHGLSDAFLADKPVFAAVADEFLAFVEGARLVIHNAPFDMGFINMELGRLGRPAWPEAQVLDTLMLARRKHPGAPASLDALCSRYGIDNSRRTKHGALLDAEILAEVYIELIGGKQKDLGLATPGLEARPLGIVLPSGPAVARRPAPSRLTDEERAAHAAFLARFKAETVWKGYLGERAADEG
ncbi:DNA polymerase III subunit epsilon [Salinarimonas sp.]|uniref:DNA polymerase III subunit epsilon n=1 Tax=Salinarimonas sp. TaxID=2766526 RepID=UPI0039189516